MARWWQQAKTFKAVQKAANQQGGAKPATGRYIPSGPMALRRQPTYVTHPRPAAEPVGPAPAPAPMAQPSRWETFTMTPAPQPEPTVGGWLDAGVAMPRATTFQPMWTEDMPTWQADYRRRWAEAWSGIGAPREEFELPEALQAARENMRWASLAGAQQAVAPHGLGLPPEQARAAWANAAQLFGAASHDIKQIPGAGLIPRVGDAVLKTFMAIMMTPEEFAEQTIAQATIPGAERFAERYAEDPERMARVTGGQVPTIVQLAEAGYEPEEIRQGLREASRIAFSSPEAQAAMAMRVIHGEDPYIVAYGKAVNVQEPSDEDIDAYLRHVTAVYEAALRQGLSEAEARQMAMRAEQDVKTNGRIPGESQILREMVGQIMIDPLNIAQWLVRSQLMPEAVKRAEEALGVVDEATVAARSAQQAPVQLPSAPFEAPPAAVAPAAEAVAAPPAAVAPAAEAVAAPQVQRGLQAAIEDLLPENLRRWARRTWKKVNPLELTPQGKARVMMDDAGVVIGTLLSQTEGAEETVDVLRRFVEDPDSLEALVGSLTEWKRSGEARELLARIVDDLEQVPSIKRSLELGADFNPADFLLELDSAVTRAASELDAIKGPKSLIDYKRFADNYRNLMSEFYLRTTGYALRNTTGDLVTMANDGLLSLDSFDTVVNDLARIGPTTPRVTRAIRTSGISQAQAMQVGYESKLGKLVGLVFGHRAGAMVGGVSESIGEFMATGRIGKTRTVLGEESRYLKAFHTALMRSLAETWNPVIPDELVEALGPVRAEVLRSRLQRALTVDEMVDAVRRVTQGGDVTGLFDYARYLGDDADEVSLELVRRIDEAMRGVTTKDELAAVFDDLGEQLDADLGKVIAGDPLPPVRRMNSMAERAQDAAEDAARIEKAAQDAGIADEIAEQVERHAAEMQQAIEETAAIETEMMTQARAVIEAGEDPRKLAAVLRDLRVETGQIQMDTRAAVDRARREVYEQLRSLQTKKAANYSTRARAAWDRYYGTVRRLRAEEQTTIRGMLQQLQDQFAQGVVPDVADDAARRAVQRYRSQLEQLAQRRERLGRLGGGEVANIAEDEREFASLLETMRLGVDEAQAEAWRVGLLNPSPDALDIMTQAERDVQNAGAAAATRAEEVYRAWRASWGTKGEWTKAQFRERVDAIWRKTFTEQANRMDTARRELFSLPLGPEAQRTLLQTLGWPAEAAGELSPEMARMVLRERIPWDAAVGGPLIPVTQLEECTLEGVARSLGIDASDPRMIDAHDWQQIAERAERDARLYRLLTDERALMWHGMLTGETQAERIRSGLRTLRGVRDLTFDDPGFAERMRRGAVWLESVADSARARAQLGTTALGKVIETIPEGTEYIERAQKGDLYLVRLMREGRELAVASFDNPAEALREAQRIEGALAKGAGVPLDYVPSSLEGVAARFGASLDDPDELERLVSLAEGRGLDLIKQVEKTTDPRRVEMFNQAVEEARRLRGFNPEDEAMYAQGMLPKGFGLAHETRFDKVAGSAARAGDVGEMTDEWYHVLSTSLEDDKMLRSLSDAYSERVLTMAGVTNVELAKLKTQQRARLLEEIANGELLRTPTGKVSKIGDIPAERRQALIRNASENVRRIAQGAVADPGHALAYEWLAIAEQAQARLETTRLLGAGLIEPGDVDALLLDSGAREALVDAMAEMGDVLADARAAAAVVEEAAPQVPTESWAAFRDYMVGETEHYKHSRHVLNAIRKEFGADYNPWDDWSPERAQELYEILTRRIEPVAPTDIAKAFGVGDVVLTHQPTNKEFRNIRLFLDLGLDTRGIKVYGSIDDLPPVPEGMVRFFHGTGTDAVEAIAQSGIQPGAVTGQKEQLRAVLGVIGKPSGFGEVDFVADLPEAMIHQVNAEGWAEVAETIPRARIAGIVPSDIRTRDVGRIIETENEYRRLVGIPQLAGAAEEALPDASNAPRLFGEEDLPLWSGVAPRGEVERFAPTVVPEATQEAMEGMGVAARHTRPAVEEPAEELADSIRRMFETELDPEVDEAMRRLVARGMSPIQAGQLGWAALADPKAKEELLRLAAIEGGMLLDEIDKASKLAGQTVEPPTLGEMADVMVQQQKRLLERMREGMMNDWDSLQKASDERIMPWVATRARKWAQANLPGEWAKARTISVETARQMADFALLDYGQRRKIDTWLSLVTPYHFWKTRSARNWAIRLSQQPATLAHFMTYNKAMKSFAQQQGYRQRFEGSLPIPTAGLTPEWMGGELFVNPASFFFPFAELQPNEWDDPQDARNGIDYLYRTLSKYGFRPFGFIQAALQATNVIGPEGLPGEGQWWTPLVDTPQTRLIQSARMMRQPEAAGPVSNIFGRLALEDWDSYRISRMLSNMSGDRPELTEDILLAQELVEKVAYGEIPPEEVVNGGPNIDRLAQVSHWAPEDVARAQQVLRVAWLRAQQEKALPGAVSAMTWTSARVLPTGERRQLELMRQGAAAGFDPLTQTGSRGAYEEFTREHPETYTRATTYQMIPGTEPPTAETWTPLERRGTLIYRRQKEQELASLEQAQLDALIQGGIWDRDSVRALREAHTDAMTRAREQLKVGEYAWPESETAFTPLYGSTPEEMIRQAEEEVLGRVSDAMPRRAQFETQEEYEAAQSEFYAALQGGDFAAIGVEMPEGLPEEALAYGRALKESDFLSFWKQNDTLPEALLEAFADWYGQQWDRYYEARGEPMDEDQLAQLTDTQRDRYYARREAAWQKWVEENRATPEAIAASLRTLYGKRWGDDEIRKTLAKMELPTTFEAWFGRKSPEEQAQYEAEQEMADAKEMFWEAYWALPEDADWRSTKGQPLVAFIVDKDTRSLATAQQYQAAAAVLKAYLAEHGGGEGEEGGGAGRARASTRSTTTRTTTTRRTSGGGGSSRGRAAPAPALETWEAARRYIGASLIRQLGDYFLRNRALGAGALKELQALMEQFGWSGTFEEFLEHLRALFAARNAPTSAPRGKYR